MGSVSGGYSQSSTGDAEQLKDFLDNYEPEAPETERLVLFRDKDGQVHVITKKINCFEGLWAKIGLSNAFLNRFGLIDANIKHVLEHLNQRKIADPRLKKVVQKYNSKRKIGKIKESDFPNLFPSI